MPNRTVLLLAAVAVASVTGCQDLSSPEKKAWEDMTTEERFPDDMRLRIWERDERDLAYEWAIECVTERLKSPASATFADYPGPDASVNKLNEEYTVESYVDSQNGFGAMLRTTFEIVLIRNGEGRADWETRSASLKTR